MGTARRRARSSPITSAAPHRIEELVVVIRRTDLVEQEFHRLHVVHRVQQLPEHPHLLQDVMRHQELLAAGAGAVDVDRRILALLGHLAVEVDFQVAGALEFLVDHVVLAAAGGGGGGGGGGGAAAGRGGARRAGGARGRRRRGGGGAAGGH